MAIRTSWSTMSPCKVGEKDTDRRAIFTLSTPLRRYSNDKVCILSTVVILMLISEESQFLLVFKVWMYLYGVFLHSQSICRCNVDCNSRGWNPFGGWDAWTCTANKVTTVGVATCSYLFYFYTWEANTRMKLGAWLYAEHDLFLKVAKNPEVISGSKTSTWC